MLQLLPRALQCKRRRLRHVGSEKRQCIFQIYEELLWLLPAGNAHLLPAQLSMASTLCWGKRCASSSMLSWHGRSTRPALKQHVDARLESCSLKPQIWKVNDASTCRG